MKSDAHATLDVAKIRRTDASRAAAETAIRAKAAAADLEVCRAHVETLEKRRTDAIAAAKPDRVLLVDALLLKAAIAVEIAAARAKTSAATHDEAMTAVEHAEAGVAFAARGQLDAEMIALAAKVMSALDTVEALGAQLSALADEDPLNRRIGPPVALPAAVEAAISRLPRVSPLDVRIDRLRANGAASVRARRIAELSA